VTIILVNPANLKQSADILDSLEGNPRINFQDDKGMAEAYQVKQVLKAIERLEAQDNVEE
jgi:hypothetical protein